MPASRASAHRTLILDALKAGGVRTATTGRMSAPCVVVEPGDPWISHERSLAGDCLRTSWRLMLVAGRADSDASFEELASWVDLVDAALLGHGPRGLQLPGWAKPTDFILDGVPYAACLATIQLET